MSEPNPSFSTSVNFSDFNEISILNDTVKINDDESELIIETNMKNEPSLSSIATEPSDVINQYIIQYIVSIVLLKIYYIYISI